MKKEQFISNLLKLNEQDAKKTLEHLEAFNDGVIAIIITIMVLEIPAPHGGLISYFEFLKSIGIFLTNFFVVANFWYELNKMYSGVIYATKGMVVVDLMYLASLAILPVLTKWIMEDPSKLAVINYGIIYMIIELLGLWISHFSFNIMIHKSENSTQIHAKSNKAIRMRTIILIVVNLAIIAFSFKFAKFMIYAYLALPIIDFFFPEEWYWRIKRKQR